jgi:hypothetical protein
MESETMERRKFHRKRILDERDRMEENSEIKESHQHFRKNKTNKCY